MFVFKISITLQNKCFLGYTGISLPVVPSVGPSVYTVLVILCHDFLLQFCLNSIKTLLIHWSYIGVLQAAILKCHLFLVEELSPLELRFFFFFLNCRFLSKG